MTKSFDKKYLLSRVRKLAKSNFHDLLSFCFCAVKKWNRARNKEKAGAIKISLREIIMRLNRGAINLSVAAVNTRRAGCNAPSSE